MTRFAVLQQTRVSTVIDYWNRWMARWPTIHDLASANPEDVLSAWRGLGYYSRASRIHAAAQKVVNDPARNGLLPRHVDELQKEVPGVGRYTAGAISSIVFGEPAPMLDGNVVRVLSRQLGIYADTKSSKHVVDSLWTAAEQLVGAVAGDADDSSTKGPSDRPGRWGQALMELGSTVCTPKPSCGQCPIQGSCRAYGEGEVLALRQGALKDPQAIHSHQTPDASAADIDDVEDLCKICEPLEVVEEEALVKADVEEEEDGESRTAVTKSNGSKRTANQSSNGKKKEGKQMSLASFSFTANAKEGQGRTKEKSCPKALNQRALDIIEAHVRQFPMRVAKKAIRQEEAIVIALRRRRCSSPSSRGGTSQGWEWKLHQRPPKGLLADMWEMPSKTIDEPGERAKTGAQRKTLALDFVEELKRRGVAAKLKREMGSVPWVFSHLKLTMHVFLVEMDGEEGEGKGEKEEEGEESGTERKRKRWASTAQVEGENMGTGMRHCWALVKGVD